ELCVLPHYLAACIYSSEPECANSGISSHVLPSSSRPAFFFLVPPHCLKKKGRPASRHWSRISNTQAGSMGRAPGPDSPPTITQSIPSRLSPGSGPRSGSSDRNLTIAPVPSQDVLLTFHLESGG